MSELKAYKPYVTRDGDMFLYHKGDEDLMLDDEDEIYLKYEVDKAISDLEESHKMEVEQLLMEIVELKQEIELLKQENEMTFVGLNLHSPTSDGRFV